MEISGGSASGWERDVPSMTDDGLLLAELSHRVRNEVSSALAAMHIALSRRTSKGRDDMVRAAVGRLEGFGEILKLLTTSSDECVNLKDALQAMCDGLGGSRPGLEQTMITVDASRVLVDPGVAQRLLMIAHELVHNAMRHALDGRRGMLAVVLRSSSREIRLAVVDDGPGIRDGSGNRGSGMGGPIVAELVRRSGGQIDCRTGVDGTRVRVRMPMAPVITVTDF